MKKAPGLTAKQRKLLMEGQLNNIEAALVTLGLLADAMSTLGLDGRRLHNQSYHIAMNLHALRANLKDLK